MNVWRTNPLLQGWTLSLFLGGRCFTIPYLNDPRAAYFSRGLGRLVGVSR